MSELSARALVTFERDPARRELSGLDEPAKTAASPMGRLAKAAIEPAAFEVLYLGLGVVIGVVGGAWIRTRSREMSAPALARA